MNDRALNIKIPVRLYDALKAEAARKNISMAAIVRVICSDYFTERGRTEGNKK